MGVTVAITSDNCEYIGQTILWGSLVCPCRGVCALVVVAPALSCRQSNLYPPSFCNLFRQFGVSLHIGGTVNGIGSTVDDMKEEIGEVSQKLDRLMSEMSSMQNSPQPDDVSERKVRQFRQTPPPLESVHIARRHVLLTRNHQCVRSS